MQSPPGKTPKARSSRPRRTNRPAVPPSPPSPRASRASRDSGAPRESPDSPARRRPDRTTIALGAAAVVLLVLIIVFFRRGGPVPQGEASVPQIERIPLETGDTAADKPAEPVIELGRPAPPEETAEPESDDQSAKSAKSAKPAEDKNTDTPPSAEARQTTARLFFIRVSDEGKIGHKSVLRRLPASSSPLTTAVNALIEGPRAGELTNDMMSLIPEGSKLLGARVEGGTAFLDFNEEFRFNALGIEGYRAQVEQLVYTVTEFPTVDQVQFLVEGQRIDYLGGEGFWVGAPLSREDF